MDVINLFGVASPLYMDAQRQVIYTKTLQQWQQGGWQQSNLFWQACHTVTWKPS